jgi:hypothetical protein
MIADVTAACASVNAIAMWVIEMPASAATLTSSSTRSSLRWFSGLDSSNCDAIPCPRSRPRLDRDSGERSNSLRR